MESHKNGRQQIKGKVSEAQVCLKLFNEILEGRSDVSQKREQLLGYCRTQELEESSMWERLALYKQHGLLISSQKKSFKRSSRHATD